MLEISKIIFSVIYVLFLPGLTLSYIFFKEKQTDTIERIALSFALSIAIVPLFIFYTNLMGIPINALNVFLQILIINAAASLVISVQYIVNHKK